MKILAGAVLEENPAGTKKMSKILGNTKRTSSNNHTKNPNQRFFSMTW